MTSPDDRKPSFRPGPGRYPQLSFDLDVEVCVIGGGLAGLAVARDAALGGMSVAVLEAQRIGWSASGAQLGTVLPGFSLPVPELIARVGLDDARTLWRMSADGAEAVRDVAEQIPHVGYRPGVLEVSTVDRGDALIGRLQLLGEDFGGAVEGWQVEQVREAVRSRRYFHGIHYPQAFQVDGRRYCEGLAELASKAGARLFEETPVISIDPAGIRKRILTPRARLRADHVVLAGNVHLGAPSRRLTETLLPIWRYAGVTEQLGEGLREALAFGGSVLDADGIDHFRIVDGDRLLWSSPETTASLPPQRLAAAIEHRIRTVFPALKRARVALAWSGAIGQTVHGMPQIGALRQGLWVASGFGRQGLNTTAMAGRLIADAIVHGDDRYRLFAPFELVWAGGVAGRAVGQVVLSATRAGAAAAGALARRRERGIARERARAAKAAASRRGAPRMADPHVPMPATRSQQRDGEPPAAP